MTTGWIEHDGKGAPDLPPGTLVLTRRGAGIEDSPRVAVEWEWWHGDGIGSNWVWPDGKFEDHYISHYRVVPK